MRRQCHTLTAGARAGVTSEYGRMVTTSTPRPVPLRLDFLPFVEHTRVTGTHSVGLQEGLHLFSLAEDLGYDVGWCGTVTLSATFPHR